MTNKPLFSLAKRYGFSLIRSRKHFVFKHPEGPLLTCSMSASDHRALRNVERDLKRLSRLIKEKASH